MKRIILEDAAGDHVILPCEDEPLKCTILIPVETRKGHPSGMDLLRFQLIKVRPKFALYREASAVTPLPTESGHA